MPPRAHVRFGQARGRSGVRGEERKVEKVVKERKHLTTMDVLFKCSLNFAFPGKKSFLLRISSEMILVAFSFSTDAVNWTHT